jgi:hypothetical protein
LNQKSLVLVSYRSLVPEIEECTPCLFIFSIYLLVLSPSVKTLFLSWENNRKLDIIVLHPYRRECFHPPSLVVCLRWLANCLLPCMLVWWLNAFLSFCDARFERHRRGRGLPQECIGRKWNTLSTCFKEGAEGHSY